MSVISLSFPFRYDYLPDIGRVFTPVIPVGLMTKNGLTFFDFIVDTGSDLTTLPHYMADRLKIDLKKCRQSKAEGIGGIVVKTWTSPIDLYLSDKLKITVRSSITNDNVTPFLLGRVDFLDILYSWNFNATRKQIEFTKI